MAAVAPTAPAPSSASAAAQSAILDCLRDEFAACRRRLSLYNRVVTPLELQLEKVERSTKPGQRLAIKLEVRLEELDRAQKDAYRRVAHLTTAIECAVEDAAMQAWYERKAAERAAQLEARQFAGAAS